MEGKELHLEAMRRTDARDIEGFLELQGDDVLWRVPGAELHGRDEVRGWVEPFVRGFSSYRHDLSRVVEVDGMVWSEGTFTGVNDGPLVMPDGEMPATGRQVTFRFGMSLATDGSGRAAEVNVYFDQLEFLGQLGLIPEAAEAA